MSDDLRKKLQSMPPRYPAASGSRRMLPPGKRPKVWIFEIKLGCVNITLFNNLGKLEPEI